LHRRTFLQGLGIAGALPLSSSLGWSAAPAPALSVTQLPPLEGSLTLYLGRGEGGLYEDVLDAIVDRNPDFDLRIRRGSNAALTNAILAEAKAGVHRADLFWAVDSAAVGQVTGAGLAQPLPSDLVDQLQPQFRFGNWVPVTGRIRTLPYNTERLSADKIPDSVMDLADSDLSIGWAPAYASFQSFVTAMRLLEGDKATSDWLRGVKSRATRYAGELGVVMAVERGAVDIGLANHYYTLRLRSGRPDAAIELAFTNNDAGCLVNASGVVALRPGATAVNFIRYLLTREVQSYLASEAYEIPLVDGVATPPGIPALDAINPPRVDLTRLADLRPTLDLMRAAGVL
jgi:iron(III) transport system substrate-binding protein